VLGVKAERVSVLVDEARVGACTRRGRPRPRSKRERKSFIKEGTIAEKGGLAAGWEWEGARVIWGEIWCGSRRA
jgi:hypothetical protein